LAEASGLCKDAIDQRLVGIAPGSPISAALLRRKR
jgi:hypothetical protein